MKLAIIIPTHNRKDCLYNILSNIKVFAIPEITIQVIVVVDGSTDGTKEMINTNFIDVNIITGSGNWWYTKCINEGFKLAESLYPDYILTFNDDLTLDKNYFRQIHRYSQNPVPNAIIGSIAFTAETPFSIVSSGVSSFNRITFRAKHYIKNAGEIKPDEFSGLHETMMLPGRGMLIPINILKSMGYFDPFFKQYHSDADFCLRALNNGYKVYINWDTKIYCDIHRTAKVSSFLRVSFKEFCMSFFNPHSRNYIPQHFVFIYRHGIKLFFPISFMLFFLVTVRAYMFKPKLVNEQAS